VAARRRRRSRCTSSTCASIAAAAEPGNGNDVPSPHDSTRLLRIVLTQK